MAKQVARGAGGRFGKAGDPGVVLRYELDATEYFATLAALDAETQAWINRTSTSITKVDRAFASAATGGITKGGKAMAVFRNAAMLAGYELAGMGGKIGKISYLLTALGIPLTALTASLGAIAALGVAIWNVDKIANWVEGVDTAKESLDELVKKLKESNVETEKARKAFDKLIQQRKDEAYDLSHPDMSGQNSLERQRTLINRQLGEDLTNPHATDAQRSALAAAASRKLQAIEERIRSIRMADGLSPADDPNKAIDEANELHAMRASRLQELNRSDRLKAYMQNFDAFEARAKARDEAAKQRQAAMNAGRLPGNMDYIAGGFASVEQQLIQRRDRMMMEHNLPWIARQTGIPQSALSQMLGLSNAGVSGGISVSQGQLAAINRAGGIGGATEPKVDKMFRSIEEIERVLKAIQSQKAGGLRA